MVVMEKGSIKRIYSADEVCSILTSNVWDEVTLNLNITPELTVTARNILLLILDEPTSGLDGKHMRIIADILRKVAEQSVTVLLITHDMEFCHLVADQVLHMHDGLFVDLK